MQLLVVSQVDEVEDVVSRGQRVFVKVLEINQVDGKDRISLSMKVRSQLPLRSRVSLPPPFCLFACVDLTGAYVCVDSSLISTVRNPTARIKMSTVSKLSWRQG